MKLIQEKILEFIENEDEDEVIFYDLNIILDDEKINDDNYKLKSFLSLLTKVANNHHRNPHFFSKIERILLLFKDNIIKKIPNSEIFCIFKSNKRLLLFLFEEKIIKIDEYVIKKILDDDKLIEAKYPHFFSPEIKPFINIEYYFIKWQNKYLIDELNKEIPDDFYEKRKKGENDNYICQLIQNDNVIEFIKFINKTNYSINSKIEPSVFETNPFLIKKQIEGNLTLIEYAAFFGSLQIFNYLRQNNNILLKSSLWLYSIHGQNAQMIHLLEENNVEPRDKSFNECIVESIKCHHNDFVNYFLINFSENEDYLIDSFKYYNFAFMKNEFVNRSLFFKLCKYNHYILVDELLKKEEININQIEISN